MKTIILMTAMFLTVAFANPAAAGRTFYYGYILADETARPAGDKLIVDGKGEGISSLGRFTLTYQLLLDFVANRATGKQQLTFQNGDVLNTDTRAIGEFPFHNIGVWKEVVSIRSDQSGTGRFAGVVGEFSIDRAVDLSTGKTFGTFKGDFVKP
jgi:hypothetical protein